MVMHSDKSNSQDLRICWNNGFNAWKFQIDIIIFMRCLNGLAIAIWKEIKTWDALANGSKINDKLYYLNDNNLYSSLAK